MKNKAPSCPPRTAVAYARYSSAGQRDVSIEQQLADIRAFAKREGYTLVHEYADHAKSGFKNSSARTAFQSMMAAADSGTFDTVLCWKVDRFGRNREESALFKGRLRRFGVKVLYAMEPIPEGSAGVLLEGMLEATAEWYSRQLSENVTRGMMDNARRCLYNGQPVLGYMRGPDGRYAIQPEEAAVVRNIFGLYCSGLSAAQISRLLNAQGVKTVRGCSFTPQAILRIVGNDRYTGVYRWGPVAIPDGMPPIVSQSVFEEAQRMKKKTTRHVEQGAVDYLLTGKAFCGYCGAAMVGDSGTSKDGTRHYYYSCIDRKHRKSCKKKSIQKDLLEFSVVEFIQKKVLSKAQIEKTAAVILELQVEEMKSSPLAAMEAEQAEVHRQIDNINNAIAAGVWSSSTLIKLKDLEATAENLRESVEMLRFSQSQLMNHDSVVFFLRQFADGDPNSPALRRSIIETFINAVYCFDGYVDLVLNNRDGNQRFPLEDLPDVFPCSDSDSSGVPNVLHPNTQVTIYRIAI